MKKIQTTKAPQAIGPYSQAIMHNGMIYCSGQIAIDPVSNSLLENDIENQTRQVFENLKAVLSEVGSGLDNVCRSEIFLKDMNDFQAVNAIYEEYFTSEIKPARVTVEVSRLPKDVLIEVSVIACVN